MNMARAELLGWGVQVTYPNLTEASFSWALNEALSNPKYQKNVLKIAKRLQDQPQTPMEKAMFYIEYVIRHEGAHFMQSSAQHLNFIEYHNLDVYGILMAAAFIAILLPIFIIKKIFASLCCKKASLSKKEKFM